VKLEPGAIVRNKRTKTIVRIERVTRSTVTYTTLPLLYEWTAKRSSFVKNHVEITERK
jgi:hypothetical protein